MSKRNPTWCGRRSTSKRSGPTASAISPVLSCLTFAICIGVVASKSVVNGDAAEVPGHRPPAKCMQLGSEGAGSDDVCISTECIHTASRILMNMDSSVDPCDDFFHFACGGFLESKIIPDDENFVDIFSPIEDKQQKELRMIMESPIKPNELKPFRLVKNLYKSCMDENAIEDQGMKPLHKILKKLGGWPVLDGEMWNDNDFDWRQSIYKFSDTGYPSNYFMGLRIGVHPESGNKNTIHLESASLGIPPENLAGGFNDEIVKAYYSYMVDIAAFLGANRESASIELKDSLIFEMGLAAISLLDKPSYDSMGSLVPMTWSELTERYSSIPWGEHFNKLLPKNITVEENEVVIMTAPRFYSQFQTLISITPKKVQANYVMWRAVEASVIHLNDMMRNRKLSFLSGQNVRTGSEPRWKQCFGTVSKHLSLSLDAMYVREYFKEESKEDVAEMIADFRQQLSKELERAEWLDDEMRYRLLKKEVAIHVVIGYYHEMLDDNKLEEFYKNLELFGDNYLEKILNLTIFTTEFELSLLRKSSYERDWTYTARPTSMNLYYSLYQNSLILPTILFRDIIFSDDRPRYMNYGALGVLAGYSMMHGFNEHGRNFDENGAAITWWGLEPNEKFLQRAECITHQYGNYTDEEVGLKLNGQNTEVENTSDNIVIKLAYLAYNNWVKRNGAELKLPGLPYSPKQMFWISSATIHCGKRNPESLKHFIRTDVLSPYKFRVLGPLSNIPEFSRDFNCPLGSKMNPEKKCSI